MSDKNNSNISDAFEGYDPENEGADDYDESGFDHSEFDDDPVDEHSSEPRYTEDKTDYEESLAEEDSPPG